MQGAYCIFRKFIMTANTYISIADDPRLDNKPIWYRQKIGIPLFAVETGEWRAMSEGGRQPLLGDLAAREMI
jgi:hypothetical protein